MTVFVELVTDAFEENLSNQLISRARNGTSGGGAGNRVARRPTRGLEIKDDTYAALKVVLSDGSELELVDSSSPTGYSTTGYTNFILQSVQEVRMEKHQLVETFGANYIYFFGESPRFLDVSAVIINSHDFNWEAEWWENYEQNFRGTRLVEKGGRLYMFYDDNIVEGYMLMCQASKQSSEPHLIPISFKLFLTNYRNISRMSDPHFPIRDELVVVDVVDVPTSDRGDNRGAASVAALPDRQSVADAAEGTLAEGPRLSEALRDARALPLRSLTADNSDEFVGLLPTPAAAPMAIVPARSRAEALGVPPADFRRLETDDLHQTSTRELEASGAEVDDPSTLSSLGLMPTFSSDARSGATFGPSANAGVGANAGFGIGFGGGTETLGLAASSTTTLDPLGAIFGGGKTSSTIDPELDSRFTEGVGDAEYGYRSEFSLGRAGFGQVGYGDLGGPGFGAGVGAAGDPGFKDPSRFTFAGVVQNKAAFNKFKKPKPTQNVFGAGAGLGSSSSGLSGGAGVRVGGKVSAFSFVSTGGTLKL
jgi:hypothetical protein